MSGHDAIPLLSLPPQSTPLPLLQFLHERDTFSTSLAAYQNRLSTLPSLHDASLSATSESSTTSYTSAGARLESTIAELGQQSRELKDFLKALERDVALTERDGEYEDGRTKRKHWEKIKGDLQQALMTFQNTERVYRGKYNAQMARQYRIVNPNATEAEVEDALASGDTQIFLTAILTPNRSANANSVAQAVRERQKEIEKIEKTLEELVMLFKQMEEQVVLQETVVEGVEDTSQRVVGDMEGGVKELGTGVKLARSTRRKKWWCLGICVGIVLIVILIVVIYFVINKKKDDKPKEDKPIPRLML